MSTAGNAQSAQSRPWPSSPAREMQNIRRGETLTCRRTTAKNLYTVTALALRLRQLWSFFLRQAKIVALSMALFFCRVESKSKDDFKFPVMVEDGKHSCTEVYSLHPSKINSVQRCFVSFKINLEYYKQLHIETNHCIWGGKSVVKKS